MREAARTLEARWIERKRMMREPLTKEAAKYGEHEERFANKLQAASRGMIARRQLQRIKSQVSNFWCCRPQLELKFCRLRRSLADVGAARDSEKSAHESNGTARRARWESWCDAQLAAGPSMSCWRGGVSAHCI